MKKNNPNIIFLAICLLGFIAALSFFNYSREAAIDDEIKQYRTDSTLHHQRLLNELDDKKAFLKTAKQYIELEENLTLARFSYLSSNVLSNNKIEDVCLINPGENTYFSIKTQANNQTCGQFDLLLPNKVFDNKNPKLFISEHTTNLGRDFYIAVIISLKNLITVNETSHYHEFLLLFDTGNMESKTYRITPEKLTLSDNIDLAKTLSNQYFTLEKYGDVELIYLSTFNDVNLPESLTKSALLKALSLFIVFGLAGFFIRKSLLQKTTLEKEIVEKNRELAHSEEFLSMIIEHNPDYIFVKDEEFKITYANQNFIGMHAVEIQDKIIGYTSFEKYTPEEADGFFEMDKKAFAEGSSETLENVTFQDGNTRILLTKKIRFAGIDQKPFILCIGRDVTERESLIQQLESSNEELKQFAYRTSHDLKAPLVTINRLTDYIEQDIKAKNDKEALNNLEKISSHATKLNTLVLDILNLTKAEQGEDKEQDIDFEEVIDEIFRKYEWLAKENKVKMQREIDKKITFKSQKVRVTQILENLISNAVKYHDTQKNKPYVMVKLFQEADDLCIEVEDNGIGIPKDKIDELFGLFTRFHPNLAEGSGLGLSIVKKHIDKLNGSVKVLVEKNKTRFIIRLVNGK